MSYTTLFGINLGQFLLSPFFNLFSESFFFCISAKTLLRAILAHHVELDEDLRGRRGRGTCVVLLDLEVLHSA